MNLRNAILLGIEFMIKTKEINLSEKDMKPNYASLARKYNCDYRTIKKAIEKVKEGIKNSNISMPKEKKIDPFKEIVISKINYGAPAIAIFNFLRQNTKFDGSYSTVKAFVHSLHAEKLQKAIVRFETTPGLQIQIDWKESLKFKTKSGKIIQFNIFLAILGYSRYKFIMATESRDLRTVEFCICCAIRYFGGASKERLFDNMRSIIDKARTMTSDPIFNANFLEFCKDASFTPKACVSYRPCTKGKVETLARLMNRLKVYNEEIETFEDIQKITCQLMDELNNEVCQATGEKPIDRFQKEKEYLTEVNLSVLTYYFQQREYRKVSKESLITYQGKKYSVPVNYIGKKVEIDDLGEEFVVTYKGKCIYTWKKSKKMYNFLPSDYKKILMASDLQDLDEDELDKIAIRNLKIYDEL